MSTHKITIVLVNALVIALYANAGLSQGKEPDQASTKGVVSMSGEQRKKLNTFFSNFSEVDLEPSADGQITETQLIYFGIRHRYLNNPKLFSGTMDFKEKIAAQHVETAVKKYFQNFRR